MEGEEIGEICNREGCKGVIESDGSKDDVSCSCHINPPCGKCEYNDAWCPDCDWSANEDYLAYTPAPINQDYYRESQEAFKKSREDFYAMYSGKTKVEKLFYRSESHTHFSMLKVGMFPPSMTMEKLVKAVRGTFGGRFKSLDKDLGRFEYVAYTD